MNNHFSIITARVIKKIFEANPEEIYKAVSLAYIRHFEKKTINPPSYFMQFLDKSSSRIIALPAAIMEDPRIAGIKWVSSNPENILS